MLNVWMVATFCWVIGAVYLLSDDLLLRDCTQLANAADSSLCAINHHDRLLNAAQLTAMEWIILPPLIGFWLGVVLFLILRRQGIDR